MTPTRVLLVGMMGTGKSTIGRALADRLGWPYLDSDDEILRTTGRTVPEIWRAQGEPAFRAEEARVLEAATTSEGPAVISVAGGAVVDADNRARVRRAGLVVWLRAEVATLLRRIGDGTGRPLLDADPSGALTRLTRERAPIYAEVADAVVDVDGLTVGEVVDRVTAIMATRGVSARA